MDTKGEIGWESGIFHKAGRPDSHVIEVLTARTPVAYKAYLRKKGVSYIVAGQDLLDCRMVMENFNLKNVKKLKGNSIRLVYTV